MKRPTGYVLIVLACCAIALGVWFNRPRPLTDAQQIQLQLQDAVRGANRHSVGEIMSIVSSSYSDDNDLNADRLRFVLGRAYRNAPEVDISMTPPIISITGDTAVTDSTLTVRESGQVEYSHPLHLDWQREKSLTYLGLPTMTWRVLHADYGPLFRDE
jgi:hypothetical protein